jgi:nitroreductase
MVGDYNLGKSFGTDMGIAAQSILLGAREYGLAGCMIGSINKGLLQELFHLPKRFEILLVIALGKPKETAVLDDMQPGDGIEYWRDEYGIHHVPKRPLDDIILSE